MRCAWKELLDILPRWMITDVDALGRSSLQELRLRLDAPPELVSCDSVQRLGRQVSSEDLSYCVNAASRYSPWAAATIAQGFLTVSGGHRIGLCGEAVLKNKEITGIRKVTSLCIRVARDFPGIGSSAAGLRGSMLILGAPGRGKTTLLRDIARQISEKSTVAVVDERGEIFPSGFVRGDRMDVLTGVPKAGGVEMVLRTMGPEWIAVDEITAEEDCRSLLQAQGCGVRLLATAHAGSLDEFRGRPIYKALLDNHVFDYLLILHSDRSYGTERIHTWNSGGLERF
ncbi:MAG: ATPase, T2SS/T4P/T4SS family [Candidatus Faecousia sp.]|nr:ATPase, T2SS/T4P/T4SS family [Candidatus Faecousia sp.]